MSAAEQITTADYFRMNAPFTVWLKKKKVCGPSSHDPGYASGIGGWTVGTQVGTVR